jgi:hypothetical protein
VSRKTYAVDWDGTLVEYNGWAGPGVYGAPVPAMLERVRKWLKEGHEVLIFTSRVSVEHSPESVMIECKAIDEALRRMGLPLLQITANKYIRISEFWDDRAVGVERNTGRTNEDLGTV